MGDSPKITVMKDHGHGKWPSMRVLLAGLLVVVTVVLVAWLVVAHAGNKKTQAAKASQAEIANLVTQSLPYLYPSSVNKLQPIATKLKQVPGCDQSPDCLYVVTTYYINNEDAQNAQAYYNKLTIAYESAKGYKNLKNAKSPTQLKNDLALVQQANAAAKEHYFGVPVSEGKK